MGLLFIALWLFFSFLILFICEGNLVLLLCVVNVVNSYYYYFVMRVIFRATACVLGLQRVSLE